MGKKKKKKKNSSIIKNTIVMNKQNIQTKI